MSEPGECVLCFEGYSPAEKNHFPVVLSCGHTLCAGCYDLIRSQDKSSGKGIKCPVCQQDDSFGAPVVNTALLAWIAVNNDMATATPNEDEAQKEKRGNEIWKKIKNGRHTCGECRCDCTAKGGVFCCGCTSFLCEACDEYIHSMPIFAKHKRTPVGGCDAVQAASRTLTVDGLKDDAKIDVRGCSTGIVGPGGALPANADAILEENLATVEQVKKEWADCSAKSVGDLRLACSDVLSNLDTKFEEFLASVKKCIDMKEEKRLLFFNKVELLKTLTTELVAMTSGELHDMKEIMNKVDEFLSCSEDLCSLAKDTLWKVKGDLSGFGSLENLVSTFGLLEFVSKRGMRAPPVLSQSGTVGSTSCTVSWADSSDPDVVKHVLEEGSPAPTFELQKRPQDQAVEVWSTVYQGLGESMEVSDLECDTGYLFRCRVVAIDSHGFKRVGCWSSVLEVRTASREQMIADKRCPRLSNTVKIDLSNMQLSRIPTVVWGAAPTALELNMSFNKLTSIPSNITTLTKLTVLQLDRNQLTAIPREVAELPNLRSLYLRTNKLNELPEELFSMPKLLLLYVTHNPCEQKYKGRKLICGKVVR